MEAPETPATESANPSASGDPIDGLPTTQSNVEPRNIHRIGGASVDNLRLKPKEATLIPPGISVIKAPTPLAAAGELRSGFPKAKALHDQAKIIGSATIEAIRNAGFDVIPTPSIALPNHHRLVHPIGVAGFSDENLERLAEAFLNTTGH